MGLRQEFNKLSLAKQIQFTFVVFILFISATLVVITKVQLDWLQTKVLKKSDDIFESHEIKQTRLLAQNEARFLSIEIGSYVKFDHSLREFSKIIIGESTISEQVLADGDPLWTNDCQEGTKNYDSSSYGSIYGKSSGGDYLDLVTNMSRLNPLLSSLYRSEYLSIMQGFQESYVINSYPGVKFDFTTYNPIVREWFYKSFENPNTTTLTEPYIDETSSEWIFSISSAINNTNSQVLGVAGVDIILSSIKKKLTIVNMLKGYQVLITAGGMIISKPDSWNIDDSVKINDESFTGFSENLWQKVVHSEPGDKFSFTDVNGTEYYMIVEHIIPNHALSEVTHYTLIMIEKDEVSKPTDKLNDKYKNINIILFWTVFSLIISVNIFVLTFIYFFVYKIMYQLNVIQKVFKNILRKALFTRSANNLNILKLENNNAGIEDLIEGCKYKIKLINRKEDDFSFYKWHLTRPVDCNVHLEWADKIYPFNRLYDAKFTWSSIMSKFDDLEILNSLK